MQDREKSTGYSQRWWWRWWKKKQRNEKFFRLLKFLWVHLYREAILAMQKLYEESLLDLRPKSFKRVREIALTACCTFPLFLFYTVYPHERVRASPPCWLVCKTCFSIMSKGQLCCSAITRSFEMRLRSFLSRDWIRPGWSHARFRGRRNF